MPNQYKAFEGEVKVLQKKNEFISEVEIWLLNGLVNRNRWRYTDVTKNKDLFVGTPILIAYVNGGNTVGDGHNFKMKRDRDTGEEYASFVSADSERIIGALSEHPEDIRVETVDGVEWIVGKGFIWNWYAAEAAKLIEQDSIQGRAMSVSIETLVTESHFEEVDGEKVEVMDNYIVLGTTVLGHGVMPAVADAKVVALSEFEEEFKELKIRAASYQEQEKEPDDTEDESETSKEPEEGTEEEMGEDDETQIVEMQSDTDACGEEEQEQEKESIKAMIFSKKKLAELQKRFEGYTVLAAEETETELHVCLMNAEGATFRYVNANDTNAVLPEKFEAIEVCAAFKFADNALEVDVSEMMDALSAKVVSLSAALEKANGELDTANSNVQKMHDAENKRRVNAAKEIAKETLAKFNANRTDKVEETVLNSVNADIEANLYTDSVDTEGQWVGGKSVEQAVLAKCAASVMEIDKRNNAAKESAYSWDVYGKSGNKVEEGGVNALLDKWGI